MSTLGTIVLLTAVMTQTYSGVYGGTRGNVATMEQFTTEAQCIAAVREIQNVYKLGAGMPTQSMISCTVIHPDGSRENKLRINNNNIGWGRP